MNIKVHKGFLFELKPTQEQISEFLLQQSGNSRFVWNKIVEFDKKYREENKTSPSQSIIQTFISNIKKEKEFEFLKKTYSQPLQVNAQRFVKARSEAFSPINIKERNKKITIAKAEKDESKRAKKLKKAYGYAFPKFKKKSDLSDSLFYPQSFVLKKSRVFLPKIGWIDFAKHRNIEGKPLSVTIKQDGDRWTLSVLCEVTIKVRNKKNLKKANIVGIDVGLEKFATLSDGTTIDNPRTLNKHLDKIKKEQKKLSKMELKSTGKVIFGREIKESSKNRDKQKLKISKMFRKVRNIRKDFLHKVVHHMISKYDGFALETLDIKAMLKEKNSKSGKNKLGKMSKSKIKSMHRNINDAAWAEFIRILEYKSLWHDKYFVKIGQWEPSSQTCCRCGYRQTMTLEDRMFICKCCGFEAPRDSNSSVVIKNKGIETLVKEWVKDKLDRENNIKNTTGTVGIYACGQPPIGDWQGINDLVRSVSNSKIISSKKQEKRNQRTKPVDSINQLALS